MIRKFLPSKSMESQLSHASSNDLLDSEELDEDEERQFFSLKK